MGLAEFLTSGGDMKTIWRVLIEAAAGHEPVGGLGHPRSSVNRVSFVVGLPPGPNVRSLVPEIGYLPYSVLVRVHRVHDLGEIVFRLRLFGLVLNRFERGKERTDQDRNDCDNNQQLDKSECVLVFLGWTHGANASAEIQSVHIKIQTSDVKVLKSSWL
jgi:hypothetical protein